MRKLVDGLMDMADVLCNAWLQQNVSKQVSLFKVFILVNVQLCVCVCVCVCVYKP